MIVAMQNVINNLDNNYGFGFVSLDLSEEEKTAIRSFSIHEDTEYASYGEMESLQEGISSALSSVGKGDYTAIAATIHRIALEVIRASGKQTALVIVRASTSTSRYDMPRWHIDGEYYSNSSLKFAAALIGNPTLFYKISDETRGVFQEIAGQGAEIITQVIKENNGKIPENILDFVQEGRKKLCELLTDTPTTAGAGEGAFFRVSNINTGAVHSEPEMNSQRLFFSVLPGNRDEIASYKELQAIL
jgi:hypothetical protein